MDTACVRPSVSPSVFPSVRLSVRPSVCPSVRLSVRPSVRQSVRPSVRPSVCPSVHQSVRPSVRPSVRVTPRAVAADTFIVSGIAIDRSRPLDPELNFGTIGLESICRRRSVVTPSGGTQDLDLSGNRGGGG